MIALLSSPPSVLTDAQLSELSGSTPASFQGIPPLLRHQELNVQLSVEPAFEGYVGGSGTLFVTEDSVSFFSSETSTGLAIPYPHITLHAISRAPITTTGTGGGPCIYCQVDESEGGDDSEAAHDEDGYAISREVIIVPADPSSLDKIFEMLSTCAALHPPPSSAMDGGGAFGGLDPDSMVYADADGNLVGPGMDATAGDDEAESSAAGRVRSDFVGQTRPSPY
ncbi:hypothetical protein RQP46_009112 [Phenoliferia psychrophenolica]